MKLTHAQIDQSFARFKRLEARFNIESRHDVEFLIFIKNPDYFEKWIHIYFANPALFVNRPHGGRVHLRPLLVNGPDDVLLALLIAERTEADFPEEIKPLLPRQLVAIARLWPFFDSCYASASDWIRDAQDKLIGGKKISMAAVHGNRYIQPIKRFEPTAKWKSRGGRRHV